MGVHPKRDGGVSMTELTAHVGNGFPSLQQQRTERVTHLVRASSMHARFVEQKPERSAGVAVIKRRS